MPGYGDDGQGGSGGDTGYGSSVNNPSKTSGNFNTQSTNVTSNPVQENKTFQGFINKQNTDSSIDSGTNSTEDNYLAAAHGHLNNETKVTNYISEAGGGSWPGGMNQYDTKGKNITISTNLENSGFGTAIGGNIFGKGSKFQVNNSEAVEVRVAVNKLKSLNPTWSDQDALNYLEGGDWAMRKFNRGDLSVNSQSQDIKDTKTKWSTFGLGLRSKLETNVGAAMDRDQYSKMLGVMSGNFAPNSEMYNLQKAFLMASKNLKHPSKFSEIMGSLPSIAVLKGLKQTLIAHPDEYAKNPTEKGSPGWMALAHRQAKRGELMPDNSNPLDSLIEFGNDKDKTSASKYKEALRKQNITKINKPMTWGVGLARGESNEDRIKRYEKLGYRINKDGELENMPIEDGIDSSGLTTSELYSKDYDTGADSPYILDLESAFIDDPINEFDELAEALRGAGANSDGVSTFYVNGNIIDINKPFEINKSDSLEYLSNNSVEDSVYNPSSSTEDSVDVDNGEDSSIATLPVWTGPRDRRTFEWMFFGDTSSYS